METTLREQHEREVTAYLKSRSVEPEMTTLKPSILRRLKHFLLSGRKKQRNKVPEQKNQMIKKTMAKTNNDNGSQKRDSGISLLFSHHSKQDSIVAYRYPY
jgi:hypothetical protein